MSYKVKSESVFKALRRIPYGGERSFSLETGAKIRQRNGRLQLAIPLMMMSIRVISITQK